MFARLGSRINFYISAIKQSVDHMNRLGLLFSMINPKNDTCPDILLALI